MTVALWAVGYLVVSVLLVGTWESRAKGGDFDPPELALFCVFWPVLLLCAFLWALGTLASAVADRLRSSR